MEGTIIPRKCMLKIYFHRYIPVDEREFARELVEELKRLKSREKMHRKFSNNSKTHSEISQGSKKYSKIFEDSKKVSRSSKNFERLEPISNAKNESLEAEEMELELKPELQSNI